MDTQRPEDAVNYVRRHAGAMEADLTPEQRDLLGRVIAKRLERGVKLELIARAVAHALPELGDARARRLGRDEAIRALAWERLNILREHGESEVALSPAGDACPVCRAAGGAYAIDDVPAIPVAGCVSPQGCRCRYESGAQFQVPTDVVERQASPDASPGESGAPARPWYRPHPPRPHGPRWTEEEKQDARRRESLPRKSGAERTPPSSPSPGRRGPGPGRREKRP